ncbi:MAG: MerR family transcriptional regulator [Bacilli bacterium]
MMTGYRIGELAKTAGVTKRTIDYYTNRGLLVPLRSESNYRLYPAESLDTLLFIQRCRSLQLPLEHIERIVTVAATRKNDCPFQEELAEIEQCVRKLEQKLDTLDPTLRDEVAPRMRAHSAAIIMSLLTML